MHFLHHIFAVTNRCHFKFLTQPLKARWKPTNFPPQKFSLNSYFLLKIQFLFSSISYGSLWSIAFIAICLITALRECYIVKLLLNCWLMLVKVKLTNEGARKLADNGKVIKKLSSRTELSTTKTATWNLFTNMQIVEIFLHCPVRFFDCHFLGWFLFREKKIRKMYAMVKILNWRWVGE